MPLLETVIALATKLGKSVSFHAASGTMQIDGHRWDRWYDLLNKREPNPLVIKRHGLTIVCEAT